MISIDRLQIDHEEMTKKLDELSSFIGSANPEEFNGIDFIGSIEFEKLDEDYQNIIKEQHKNIAEYLSTLEQHISYIS